MNNIYTIKKSLVKLGYEVEHSNSTLYMYKTNNRNLCMIIKDNKNGKYDLKELDYITQLNSFKDISLEDSLEVCKKFMEI